MFFLSPTLNLLQAITNKFLHTFPFERQFLVFLIRMYFYFSFKFFEIIQVLEFFTVKALNIPYPFLNLL